MFINGENYVLYGYTHNALPCAGESNKQCLFDTSCFIQRVIEVCKEHLPNMAVSLKDPRVQVHVGDGVEFMKENKGNFDVIITDAPDPIGSWHCNL